MSRQALIDTLRTGAANSAGQDVVVEWIGIERMIVAIAQADVFPIVELVIDFRDRLIAVLARTGWKKQCPSNAIAIIEGRIGIQRQQGLHGGIGGRRRQWWKRRVELLQDRRRAVIGTVLGGVDRRGYATVRVVEDTSLELRGR